MGDAGSRTAGRLDHHVDALVGASRRGRHRQSACARCAPHPSPRSCRHALARSGSRSAMTATSRPCDRRHLRQKHRAEFAGADQPDAHRLAGLDARGEEGLQVHISSRSRPCPSVSSSAKADDPVVTGRVAFAGLNRSHEFTGSSARADDDSAVSFAATRCARAYARARRRRPARSARNRGARSIRRG